MQIQTAIDIIAQAPILFWIVVVVLAAIVWYLRHRHLDAAGDREQWRQAMLSDIERWYEESGE